MPTPIPSDAVPPVKAPQVIVKLAVGSTTRLSSLQFVLVIVGVSEG